MSALLEDVGLGLNAGSDLLGGFASFAAGGASASSLKATAARARVATNLKLVQQDRQGFMLQSKARAAIGAQGWDLEGGGSAADILRSNASNLALDHGIIQMEGSELESKYLTAASAAKSAGMGGLLKGVIGAVGVLAAPFTGGASLGIAGAASGAVGAIM